QTRTTELAKRLRGRTLLRCRTALAPALRRKIRAMASPLEQGSFCAEATLGISETPAHLLIPGAFGISIAGSFQWVPRLTRSMLALIPDGFLAGRGFAQFSLATTQSIPRRRYRVVPTKTVPRTIFLTLADCSTTS